jgi:hypothetical protein
VYNKQVRFVFFGVAVVSLVGIAACLDFSALSGDDAGTSNDASIDQDAIASNDAGNDGGFDVLVPPLVDASFCGNVDATFCDDFDTTSLAARWDTFTVGAGGTLGQDPSDAATSPPNTLLVNIPLGTVLDEFTRDAYLHKHLTGPITHIDVSFDLRMEVEDTVSDAGKVQVAAISGTDSTGTVNSAAIYVGLEGGFNDEHHIYPDGGADDHTSAKWFVNPVAGQWVRVEIALDFPGDGGVGQYSTSLNSSVVLHGPFAGAWTFGTTPQVEIGITYAYQTLAAWQVRYDDVVIHAY